MRYYDARATFWAFHHSATGHGAKTCPANPKSATFSIAAPHSPSSVAAKFSIFGATNSQFETKQPELRRFRFRNIPPASATGNVGKRPS